MSALGATFGRVWRIARGLRYHSLPELPGQTLRISSVEAAPAEILSAFSAKLPAGCDHPTPGPEQHALTLAKYDLLDLTFEVAGEIPAGDAENGMRLLRSLGFIPAQEFRKAYASYAALLELDAEDPTCLADLDEDLQQGRSLLRLLLRTDRPAYEGRTRLELPAGYFPCAFIVIDACLTNAQIVWLWKHFYL